MTVPLLHCVAYSAAVAVLRFAVVVGGSGQTAGWAVCHRCQLCVVTNPSDPDLLKTQQ